MRLRDGIIVDGTTPEPRPFKTLDIVDGKLFVDSGAAADAAFFEVSISDRYVMPAIWDVHCHPGMTGPRELAIDRASRIDSVRSSVARAARAGVVGLRAVGEALGADVAVRDETIIEHSAGRQGVLLASGTALKPIGGHGWTPQDSYEGKLADPWGSRECRDAAEFESATYDLIRTQHVDWVKLFVSGGISGRDESYVDTHMSFDEIVAVCRAAHGEGVPVAAHAGNPEAVDRAVRAGVTSIEHGYCLDESNASLMAKLGTWLVPTLSITHNVPQMRAMGWSAAMIDKAQALAPAHRESMLRAYRAGVRLASGSDMRPVGPVAIDEVLMLHRHGLSAFDAMRIATIESATLCGRGELYGTIQSGKSASFIVLDENPLSSLEGIRTPCATVVNGSVHWRRK